MHRIDHSRFRKTHDFVPDFSHAERRTRIVIGVTAAMMIIEIVALADAFTSVLAITALNHCREDHASVAGA